MDSPVSDSTALKIGRVAATLMILLGAALLAWTCSPPI